MDQELSTGEATSEIEALLGEDLNMLGDEVDPVADEPTKDQPDADNTDGADASEEDGEEGEEGQETDDPDTEDEESPPSSEITDETLVDIQIGEDTYEVNFAELREGYLRNEDYSQRVQALNSEHEARMAELEEKQTALLDELRLVSVIATSETSKYDKVNWEALKAQDPDRYAKLRVEALEAKEQAQALEARRQQVAALHQQAQEIKYKVYLKTQAELTEKLIPGFREPETLKALLAYGKDVGYTEEEVLSIADARHLLLLNNARLHAQSVVRKKEAMASKVDKELPLVNKPGTTKNQSSTDRKVVKSAKARLNSERSVDAAAAYLMTLDFDK